MWQFRITKLLSKAMLWNFQNVFIGNQILFVTSLHNNGNGVSLLPIGASGNSLS